MTTMQAAIMIGLAALATQITRWTPFLLFRKRTPEIIASTVTLGLQAWKRNMAVSIAGGTLCYMALVQFIFR